MAGWCYMGIMTSHRASSELNILTTPKLNTSHFIEILIERHSGGIYAVVPWSSWVARLVSGPSSDGPTRARPKSPNLGIRFSSNNILAL